MIEMNNKIFNNPTPIDGTNKNHNIVITPKQGIMFVLTLALLIAVVQFAPNIITQMQTSISATSGSSSQPNIMNNQLPIVTPTPAHGTATPSSTQKWQETTTAGSYIPKFKPNGPDNPTGNDIQEVALNNLPKEFPIATRGILYMKNVRIEGNYLYGDLVSTIDLTNQEVTTAFLDKNGNLMIKAGESGLLYGGYDGDKKMGTYETHQIGAIKLKTGKERYFRVLIPDGAFYLRIKR